MFKSQYLVVAINNFIGPSAAAVYNLTARLPQLNMLFCSKISSPFFPFIAQYVSDENQMNMASRAFVKLTRIVLRFSVFFAILTFALTKPFVLLWVGANNFAGNEILFMICLASLMSSSLASFGFVVFATKKFENWVFFSIFEIIFAIVISYAFSEHYGFLGVVSGFALASFITFVYLVRIVLRQLNMNLLALFTNTIRYALLANISTLLLAIISIKYFYISTWTELFIACCIFGIFHLIFTEGLMIINSKEIGFREKVIKVLRDELIL
jgi:O-antigen/teichoic acid export membrane protein